MNNKNIEKRKKRYINGVKQYEKWLVNGKLHREDGPAIEWADGSKEWYINGKLHREDGPAVEKSDGIKEWWINGKLHREDGPAIIDVSNDKINKYYVQGKELTKAKFSAKFNNSQLNKDDSLCSTTDFRRKMKL